MTEQLDHIRWRRLPYIDPRRPKNNQFGSSPPLRPSVSEHADGLQDSLLEALGETTKEREINGIDPNKLLVLSFEFANVDERKLLEKIGLQVIQEREIRTPISTPKYAVNLAFENESNLKKFVGDSRKFRVTGLEQKRSSSGKVSPTKIDILLDSLEDAKAFLTDLTVKEKYSIEKISKTAQKRNTTTSYNLLVQFSDQIALAEFRNEFSEYSKQSDETKGLTSIQRQRLFDAIERISNPLPTDRIGARLMSEGFPEDKSECYLDVDLWHPGNNTLVREASTQFQRVVQNAKGSVTEPPWAIGDTLLISRVKGTKETLEALKNYDRVCRVDLPPVLEGIQLSDWIGMQAPGQVQQIAKDGPLACLVDSGVVSRHPLLAGIVVDARDFDSGEANAIDQVGHGTHVAGILAYGDTRSCITNNNWTPKIRLLSAKVMKRVRLPSGLVVAGFADEKRVETQLIDAIRTYSKEYNCRIFNLSLGNSAYSYGNGPQLPWAYVLDEIARTLDVVIVVAAGNVSMPRIPQSATEPAFQEAVRDQLFTEEHRLIDPGSSVMALTVGSLARSSPPYTMQQNPGHRGILGSPGNQPSPFTRTSIVDTSGSGLRRVIKPELVWYGGNYSVPPSTKQWNTNDPSLGELSLKHDFQSGRLLSSSCGTSFAAPFIAHVAALVEDRLRKQDPTRKVSANLIRAMVVQSASTTDEMTDWLSKGVKPGEAEERVLRSVGYGLPNIEKACFSTNNRSVLFAEDSLKEDYFHLYEVELPDEFVNISGERRIKITLAYDPPVSGTRKEYLSRTMWFELYRGLTATEIRRARTPSKEKKERKVNFKSKQVDFRPTFTTLQWSTIQSGTFIGKTKKSVDYRESDDGPVLFHILVGSINRFESGATEDQNYALVVSFEHSNQEAKIHALIRQKNLARIRQHWGGN